MSSPINVSSSPRKNQFVGGRAQPQRRNRSKTINQLSTNVFLLHLSVIVYFNLTL